MEIQWENWCRLCGQEDGERFNIFIKNENLVNFPEAIEKFLSIKVTILDEIPKKICSICHEFIISMLNFSEKSTQVQQMFEEIQLDGLIDLKTLRTKYNLMNDIEYVELLVEEKIFKENDTKIFIDLGENIENNHDKLLLSSQEIIKKPRLRKSVRKPAVKIDGNTSLANMPTNFDSCKNNLDNQEEFYSSDHNNDNEMSVETNEEIGNRQYFCNICKKKCTTHSGYRLHMKFKHSVVIPKDTMKCNECGKVFKEMRNLSEHKKLHLPPDERKWYPCPHCDKKFAYFWYVSVHIRTVHEKERSFICEECGKSFATRSLLQNHQLVHTDLKPFQCPQCSNSFKCSRSLKHHIDSHQDTKYICPICQVQLNTKKILRLHMVIHSDVKKFKCKFCEKEFKRSKALKNHLISHMGIKPYECSFCEQTFANGSNCRKHQKVVHPIELAEQEKVGDKKFCKLPKLEHLQAMTYICPKKSDT